MPVGATKEMKKRLWIGIIIVAVFLCYILGTLININVVKHDFWTEYADNHQLRPETIPAHRGTIYDRNMTILAQSATVWNVVLSPANIKLDDKEEVAKSLSELLGLEYEDVLKKANKKNQYEIVARKVEDTVAEEVRTLIKDNKWAGGIALQEDTKRYYPKNTLASSVLGFAGADGNGLYGLEYKYDKELSGTPGYIVSLKNGRAENIPTSYEQRYDPVDGSSLVLTIDETIQLYLEKTLQQVMIQHAPNEGCAGIVMDVNTGAILAMANLPNFDLNQPFVINDETKRDYIATLPEEEQKKQRSEALGKQWSNKCVSYLYQPGSTFKTVVAASALEEKTSSLDSHFYCPGYVMVADRKMRCHKDGGHGQLNFIESLVGSCNPAFVSIGASLGANNFYKYFEGFGLTEKTGIDLPAEERSSYYTADKLHEVELASCSFGQSMALTPIQVCTAVSAVVNGGNVVTPYVVQDIVDANGNIVKSHTPEIKRQVISEETSKTLRMMMQQVVEVKTGTNAVVKGYKIGGKSGTSQKQTPGSSEDVYVSSYIGVAPIDNPQIAVYVMVDEATSGDIYGSVIAAPAVSAIMADVLPYLGYSPNYTEEELETMEVSVPNLTNYGVLEATGKLAALGLNKPTVIGNGEKVLKQVPGIGEKMPKDGKIILYTESTEEETVIVPNVLDLSPPAAKRKLEKLNLNVIVRGSGGESNQSKLTMQSLPADQAVPIGTVIEITSVIKVTD